MSQAPDDPRGAISRRHLLGVGAAGLAGLAAAACIPPTVPGPLATTAASPVPAPASAAARRIADLITLGSQTVPTSLDPQSNLGQARYLFIRPIFDALVSFDPTGSQIVGQLATAWRRQGPTAWEFDLRPGVRFANGEALNVATVKANFDRVLDPAKADLSQVRSRLATVDNVEVAGPNTIRVNLNGPDGFILNRLTMLFMIPESVIRADNAASTSIGSGPYRVTAFQNGNSMDLEAWNGSWRGAPLTRTWRIQILPEMSSLVSALRAGDIDIANNLTGFAASELDARQFPVLAQPTGSCTTMPILQDTLPILADRRVRHALNFAIDKEALARAVAGGFAQVAQGQLIEPGMEGFDTATQAFPYDPNRARTLLREAGVTSLTLQLVTATTARDLAVAVQGYLREVGITMNIDAQEPAVYSRNTAGGPIAGNIFYTRSNYWHIRTFDAAAQNYAVRVPPFFPNNEFRSLYLQARTELDSGARAGLITRQIRMMREDAPCIFLLWDDHLSASSRQIPSLFPAYDMSLDLARIEKVLA